MDPRPFVTRMYGVLRHTRPFFFFFFSSVSFFLFLFSRCSLPPARLFDRFFLVVAGSVALAIITPGLRLEYLDGKLALPSSGEFLSFPRYIILELHWLFYFFFRCHLAVMQKKTRAAAEGRKIRARREWRNAPREGNAFLSPSTALSLALSLSFSFS